MKYLGISLNKEAKDVYSGNFKILKGENVKDARRWQDSCAHGLLGLIL